MLSQATVSAYVIRGVLAGAQPRIIFCANCLQTPRKLFLHKNTTEWSADLNLQTALEIGQTRFLIDHSRRLIFYA